MSWLRIALCSLLFSTPAIGSMQNVADRIYYGGDIITLDDDNPEAAAVAIGGGRILRAGKLADVVRLRGASTELIDLEDRTLAPGFIDAHSHVSRVGLQVLCANLMPPPEGRNTSISAIQETLRLWMAQGRLAAASGIVIGFGYSESQFTREHVLTREALDAVSTELPVIAIHYSGQRSVFNSKALKMAGITAGTPDPYGGAIHRRPGSDEPDGMLEKAAHYTALAKVLSGLGKKSFIPLIEAGQKLYARYGYTTAQDGRIDPGALAAYPDIAAVGRLRIDVVAFPDLLTYGGDPVLRGPLQSRDYHNGFRIGGVMLRLDGARRPETARLRRSYLQLTSGPVRSIASGAGFDDDETASLVTQAFRNGWQVLTYATGDGAIDQFIKAVRVASMQEPGGDRRPVLILQQALRPDQIGDIRDLGIVPAFSPAHLVGDGPGQGQPAPGSRSAAHMPAMNLPGRRELRFTIYHDAPAALPKALDLLPATLTASKRGGGFLGTGAGLSRLAALKAITLWAAYELSEDDRKGSIEAGKLADLVILSVNPLKVDARRIGNIEVLETLKEGETIYLKNTDHKAGGPPAILACAKSPVCRKGLTAALGSVGFVSAGRQNMAQAQPGASGFNP